MGKYIKTIRSTNVDLEWMDSFLEPRFIQKEQLDNKELDAILTYYQAQDIIYFDLSEFKSLNSLREALIQEMDQEYPCKMDSFHYLDEAMEFLDENYRMNWVLILENWDAMDSLEYQRFLKSILKNGILNRGLKKVIVTGKKKIQDYGFTQFITL